LKTRGYGRTSLRDGGVPARKMAKL
jgi:hypothetical protein